MHIFHPCWLISFWWRREQYDFMSCEIIDGENRNHARVASIIGSLIIGKCDMLPRIDWCFAWPLALDNKLSRRCNASDSADNCRFYFEDVKASSDRTTKEFYVSLSFLYTTHRFPTKISQCKPKELKDSIIFETRCRNARNRWIKLLARGEYVYIRCEAWDSRCFSHISQDWRVSAARTELVRIGFLSLHASFLFLKFAISFSTSFRINDLIMG